MSEPSKSDHETFEAEHIICKKGEPGGDLLFIIEGRVEVFDPDEGEGETRLIVMNKSEIIGVATCLTNSARLASVRALEKTTIRRVSHEQIMRVMGKLPEWLFTLLKDLNLRLSQMNGQFGEAERKVSQLKTSQTSHMFYLKQICLFFANTADLMATKSDEGKYVVEADLRARGEASLGMEKSKFDLLFSTIVDAGLLAAKVEPENKKRVISVEALEKLKDFAAFIDEYPTRKYKALRKSHFGFMELKLLFAAVKLAMKEEKDLAKNVVYSDEYLQENLPQYFGQEFDPELVHTSQEAGLIEKVSDPEAGIRFVPSTLNGILINIAVYKTVLQIDEDSLLEAKRKGPKEEAA